MNPIYSDATALSFIDMSILKQDEKKVESKRKSVLAGRSWALRHATNSSSLSRAPLKLAVQRSRHSPCTAALPSDAHVASLNCKGKKFGVVVARFNDIVTKLLLEGALDAFRRHGDAEVEVWAVPIIVYFQSTAVQGTRKQDILILDSQSSCTEASCLLKDPCPDIAWIDGAKSVIGDVHGRMTLLQVAQP